MTPRASSQASLWAEASTDAAQALAAQAGFSHLRSGYHFLNEFLKNVIS